MVEHLTDGTPVMMPNTPNEAKMIELLVNAINEASESGLKIRSCEVRWGTSGTLTLGRDLEIRAYFG